MPKNDVRAIVLFEDSAHRIFMIRLCEHLGIRPTFVPCVDCNGILRRFEVEIETTRQKMRYQTNLALIVVIDADDAGVRGRVAQLEHRLEANGGRRDSTEKMAFVVPARHIETWYVHLTTPEARPVDERADYKHSEAWAKLKKDMGKAAKAAVAAWDRTEGRADPESMTSARNELQRL